MVDEIDVVLKNKVIEASGCTEPIAVAYACANAASLLDSRPSSIELELSANVIKNAMIVCLPGTKGKYGIKLAAAMGALYGKASNGLNVIAGFSDEQVEQSEEFSDKVSIKAVGNVPPLYIKAKVIAKDGSYAIVVVSHYHTFIAYKEVNGKVLQSVAATEQKTIEVNFGINDVFKYVDGGNGDMLFVDKIIDINGKMSSEGLCHDYGLKLGKATADHDKAYTLLSKLDYILQRTTAAVDARMAGADLPVMSNSGSGNQGLIATVPVMAAAEALNVSEDLKRKCVLMSSLIAIYIKSKHDVLSAYCGAAIAGTGVAAALTYMMGGDESKVRMAIQNSLGNTFGVLCDGAKETCSLKVANCTFSAVYSAFLALKGNSPKMKEGVICPDAEGTIDNIASLGKKTSALLDKALMEIMLD